MKKRLSFLIAFVLILTICHSALSANYTLPEKMYNQLSIGSGLKGSFMITSEGEKFNTPFIRQITDAEFSIRGISSGKDLHYYIFQQPEDDQQTAVNELYRKDGIYYFRSDMVQGTILAFPTLSQILDFVFPANGDNPSSSSFISSILTLPDEERKEKWDPVLNRYQKELEMWLADFTVQADSVKLDNGTSALDLSYNIPVNKINEQIITIFSEFTKDAELSELLSSIMTDTEKNIYCNENLMYFYQDALKALDLQESVMMNKRVSAMGDLLRFSVKLPLNQSITGFASICIDMVDQLTVYTLEGNEKLYSLAIPEIESFSQTSYNLSVWFACINQNDNESVIPDMAFRADITKTNEVHDDENEKSHETDHFHIVLERDTKYLPVNIDLAALPDAEDLILDVDLHYSSKYAQNSATTLDITADILSGDSAMHISGKLKTAAPWLFMPFDIIDPVYTNVDIKDVIEPYFTDWISNAASIIRHISDSPENSSESAEEKDLQADTEQKEMENAPADSSPDAETDPLHTAEDEKDNH